MTPMSITTETTSQWESVYQSLPTAAEGWATAKAVAEVVELSAGVVTRRLQALEQAGRVESSTDKAVTGARGKVWRQRADRPRVLGGIETVELPAAAVEPDHETIRVEVGADGCGCPVTSEMTTVGGEPRSDIEGTDRTEHRDGCWNAPGDDVPADVARAAQDRDAEAPDPITADDYAEYFPERDDAGEPISMAADDEDGDPSPISPAPTGSDVAAIVEAMAPAVGPLTQGDARALTDRIRRHVTEFLPLIKQAYDRRADLALGYASWAEYCDTELRGLRLPLAERQAATAELRAEGMSTRAIAGALGSSEATVRRDVEATGAAGPDRTTGLDGRSYPASKPKTAADAAPHTAAADGAEDLPTRSDDAPAGGGGSRLAAAPGNPPQTAAGVTKPPADGAEGVVGTPDDAPAAGGGGAVTVSPAAPGGNPLTAAGHGTAPADGAEGVPAPVQAPAGDGGTASAVPGNPPAEVWIAAARKGIQYHRAAELADLVALARPDFNPPSTACGRSTRTGAWLSRHAAEFLYDATPCPRCWPEPAGVLDQAVEDAELDTAERERGAHTRKPTPEPTDPAEPLAPDAEAPTDVAPAPALIGEVLPAPARPDPAHVAAVGGAVDRLTGAVSVLEEVLQHGRGGPLTLPDLRQARRRLDKLIRCLDQAA